MRAALLASLALVTACGDSLVPAGDPDAAPPGEEPGPAAAVVRVPRDGEPPPPFYDLPYPSDLRLLADGRIDLTDHPRPNDLIAGYLDAIAAGQRGFGLASAVFLRFDGAIDPATVPAPFASDDEGSPLYLIDVDPDSPARGRRVPIEVRIGTEPMEVLDAPFLAVQPVAGFLLDESTTYAVVATRRLRATDGTAVAVAPDVQAILADEAPADPALVRARAAYQPLLDWLDEPGDDERADVVSATVFTTQDATSLLDAIRVVVHRDVPAPTPRGLRLLTERDGYAWYEGTYQGPRFQAGESPYRTPEQGGSIELDPETGEPIVQGLDTLRFALTLPLGPRPAGGWPVVLYAHGTGGDYRSFIGDGTARRLAAAGLATISIDQVLHGTRNTTLAPELAFFNYQNPYAARDNTLQGALDDFQLVRLVLGFAHTERHPGGRTIKFDPERVYFFGHSQGSLTGIPFVTAEPTIKAAVFSGAGGLLYQALLHKTEPLDIPGVLRLFIRDEPLDRFHPVLNLLQAYMERADSAAYARRLVADDARATSVFVSEGLIDRYTPVETIEALAVSLEVDVVGEVLRDIPGLAEAGGRVVAPPLTGNRGDRTIALVQYEEVAGSDGHFVVFDVPAAERQSVEFLRTMAETGQATVVAP